MRQISLTQIISFIFFLFIFVCSVQLIVFAIDILQSYNYETFYGLLENPFLQNNYLGRLIIQIIQFSNKSIINTIYLSVVNIHIAELVFLFVVIYLISASKENDMIHVKKGIRIIFMILCIFSCLTLVYVVFFSTFQSVQQAIEAFHIIAMIMIVLSVLLITISLVMVYIQIKIIKNRIVVLS